MLSQHECYLCADFYDKYERRTFPLLSAKIARLFDRTGATVVDMGCGPGHLSVALAKRLNANVIAADVNPAMLELAAARAAAAGLSHRITPLLCDVHDVPLEAACADLVVSYTCLHHWTDPARGLAECMRLLRPGGLLVVIDVAPVGPATMAQFRKATPDATYFGMIEKAYRESYAAEQARAFATAAGLEDFTIEPHTFAPEDYLEALDEIDDLPFDSSANVPTETPCWILCAPQVAHAPIR